MMLERTARAKINLGLAVKGKRQDGHHELESVFLRVGLADRLAVTVPVPSIAEDVLAVAGDLDCPIEGNLVLAATQAMREAAGPTGERLPGLAIALEKGIPVAAGMGGGSSDAAAALALAQEAWDLRLTAVRIDAVGVALGADVPFFMANLDAALVSGFGEFLQPLPGIKGGAGFLLVTPPRALSTAAVFTAHDALPPGPPAAHRSVAQLAGAMRYGLDGTGLAAHAADLAEANDLWPAALATEPSLGALRARLHELLERPILMTGSGPTLAALYPSVEAAVEAGHLLATERPGELAGARSVAVDQVSTFASWRFP